MEDSKFNKVLNEKYFLLQDIAKKYHYSEELLDMITLIYIGFYMDFGKECDFPLYDLFNRVKIIYDHGTVSDVAVKNQFKPISADCAAITLFTPNLNVFKNVTLKQNPPTILLGTHVREYLATPAFKLEMLAHEVRHALMGYYHSNILLDENTYYMRSGLSETFYLRDAQENDHFTVKRVGSTFAEVMNTYITERLVNRIMTLKRYSIDNANLKSFLDSIKTSQADGKYRAIGYHSEVRLLYPLLLNEIFIQLVNQHEFDGEISIIKTFIESNTDICSYEDFCQLLDEVYNGNGKYSSEVQNNNAAFVCNHINNINRTKAIVSDIRNKILQKSK